MNIRITERSRRVIALVLLIAAAAMIGLGLSGNDASVVWKKSTKICLECIGIG